MSVLLTAKTLKRSTNHQCQIWGALHSSHYKYRGGGGGGGVKSQAPSVVGSQSHNNIITVRLSTYFHFWEVEGHCEGA